MPLGPRIAVTMDVSPYRLSGAVYGALLNHRSALQSLGDAINRPPYNGAPQAPVLYIKPRNTLAADGDSVALPAGVAELEIGASLGVVIGRPSCRLTEASALEHVAGYLIVNDVSVPHSSYYRPSLPFRARDGFCPLGARVVPSAALANPDAATIRIYLDGELRQTTTTAELVRPVAKLLSEVTDFMTLSPGDVLAVGVAFPAPRVRAGQRACIEIDGVGRLGNQFVASTA
jgi:5-oxopent-3-ene-1,2,5-tricarboxylate decarboxylase / 2-hydroxyhepta-2,4-diene-1,7-dioate isomerase